MLLAVILTLQTASGTTITNNRVPSVEVVQELETKLKLPTGALPFAQYTRFYTEADVSGHDAVLGQLVETKLIADYNRRAGKPVPPAVVRGLESDMVPISGGGCAAAVTVLYDVEAKTPPMTACNAPGPGGH